MKILGKVIHDWVKQMDWIKYHLENCNWVLEEEYEESDWDDTPIIIKDNILYDTVKLRGDLFLETTKYRYSHPINFKSLIHKYAKSLNVDGLAFECPKEMTAEIIDYLKSKGCKEVRYDGFRESN